MKPIQRNQTWELTELPASKKVIDLKWVFKTKYQANGKVQCYKAHLVARGYTQQQGINYDEVFSPKDNMDTMRLLLALAAQQKWQVFHLDKKSTFLNGEIQD